MPNDSESEYFPDTSKSFRVVPSHFQIKIVADLEVLRTGCSWNVKYFVMIMLNISNKWVSIFVKTLMFFFNFSSTVKISEI